MDTRQRCGRKLGARALLPTGSCVDGEVVRRAIHKLGARVWFLPSYSPDFNQIGQAFAKITHWMRDAQTCTVEDTWRHLGALFASTELRESQNYIRNADYGSAYNGRALTEKRPKGEDQDP